MITEDYVSFETAKLLKEKGFDEVCKTAYETITNEHEVEQCSPSSWGKLNQVKRPTLQMAMKWLREEKKIFIAICHCTYPQERKVTWIPEISTFDSVYPDSAVEYDTYEEAAEAAIKYCNNHLI